MKIKLLVLSFFLFSIGAKAQIFSPRPKPIHQAISPYARATTPLPDSTFKGLRLDASLVVQAYPGSLSLAGVGLVWESDTYNNTTGNWYTNVSAGVFLYAGGSIAPTNLQAATALGANVSFLNKRISVGGAYNFLPASSNGSHFLFTLGTSIPIIN